MSREIYCRAVLDSGEIHAKATLGQTVVEYVGESTVATHSIHLVLEDGTEIDIPLFYDDEVISAAITEYIPAEYDGKTVESAALDGVVWYTRPVGVWVTLIDRNVDFYPSGKGSYSWMSDMGAVEIISGDTYRITFNGTAYESVSHEWRNSEWSTVAVIGDELQETIPIRIYRYAEEAWIGDITNPAGGTYPLKVEHLVI